ncbi:hypothetical protein ACTPEU_00320 [Clostridioides difficile]
MYLVKKYGAWRNRKLVDLYVKYWSYLHTRKKSRIINC